jgi:hypothetical protein
MDPLNETPGLLDRVKPLNETPGLLDRVKRFSESHIDPDPVSQAMFLSLVMALIDAGIEAGREHELPSNA